MDNKIDMRLPISVNEATIKRHYAKHLGELVADDVLDSMHDAMQLGREAAEHALEAHEKIMGNIMLTEIARQRQSRDATFRFFESASKRIDAARDRAERAISHIEAATSSPGEPKSAAEAFQRAEIRNVLAGMSPDQRAKAIGEAIDTDDRDVLMAALVGPVMLTALGNAEREALKDRWRRKKFPDQVDRQRRLRAALKDLDRGQALLMTFIMGLTDGDAIAKAEAAEAAALTASKVA